MNLISPADTLVCDTAQIALWQSDPAYNYNRELGMSLRKKVYPLIKI